MLTFAPAITFVWLLVGLLLGGAVWAGLTVGLVITAVAHYRGWGVWRYTAVLLAWCVFGTALRVM